MSYRFLLFLFLGLSIALNVQVIVDSSPARTARALTAAAFFPFQYGFDAFVDFPSAAYTFLLSSYNHTSDTQKLKAELEAARAKAAVCGEMRSENERLRNALGFKGRARYSFSLIPAMVVARDESAWNSFVTIDAGRNKGVAEGLTVISESGLAGKVVEVAAASSRVLLITSPQSSISVMLSQARTFGIARGRGGNVLFLDYVPEEASVEVSDRVVVSPASHAFIPGIPVGEVIKAEKSLDDLFQRIQVRTDTDFSKLEVVFVCK